jgi:hypothetical protein
MLQDYIWIILYLLNCLQDLKPRGCPDHQQYDHIEESKSVLHAGLFPKLSALLSKPTDHMGAIDTHWAAHAPFINRICLPQQHCHHAGMASSYFSKTSCMRMQRGSRGVGEPQQLVLKHQFCMHALEKWPELSVLVAREVLAWDKWVLLAIQNWTTYFNKFPWFWPLYYFFEGKYLIGVKQCIGFCVLLCVFCTNLRLLILANCDELRVWPHFPLRLGQFIAEITTKSRWSIPSYLARLSLTVTSKSMPARVMPVL